MNESREVTTLKESDLVPVRVYEFMPESGDRDETWVQEITDLPVDSLDGRLLGVAIRLANGSKRTALIGNLSIEDPSLNEHFITLGVYRTEDERFELARYHDFDHSDHGPVQLAEFLGFPMSDVFPIRLEVGRDVLSGVDGLVCEIPAEPKRRLSRSEIIALAVRVSGRAHG